MSSILPLIWLTLAACSAHDAGQPAASAAGTQQPAAPAAGTQRPAASAAGTQQPAASAAGEPQKETPVQAFQPSDPAFQAWLDAIPALALPLTLPVADASAGRPIDGDARVCGARFYDCAQAGAGAAVRALGRVAVSPTAVGVVVHSVGPRGSTTGLLTYDTKGTIVGGQILGAEIEGKWGYSGRLGADLLAERGRFVGPDREVAETETFRVRPSGAVELTIE